MDAFEKTRYVADRVAAECFNLTRNNPAVMDYEDIKQTAYKTLIELINAGWDEEFIKAWGPKKIMRAIMDENKYLNGVPEETIVIDAGTDPDSLTDGATPESDMIMKENIAAIDGRHEELMKMVMDGATEEEIAVHFGCSHQRVSELIQELRKKVIGIKVKQERHPDRDREIYEMHRGGKKQKEIAAYFGMSQPRICQIIRRMRAKEGY